MNAVGRVVRQHIAALRLLLVLTVVLGVGYPLLITGIAQIPGLRGRADGSPVHAGGRVVGSSLLGQAFTDRDGNPLARYFQPRPSAAGEGYDPTASGASNLGPESVVDVLPDPSAAAGSVAADGKPSLLTQVCGRSRDVGAFDGVSGARPFCSPDGTGSVLAVFWSGPGYAGTVTRVVSVNQACPGTPFVSTYLGVMVQCATFGEDTSDAQIVPVRGDAPADPAVPADAVTASGSGLDPDISPAYAAIQVARVAAARGLPVSTVQRLVARCTDGPELGFLGQATVNVLDLNRALDGSG